MTWIIQAAVLFALPATVMRYIVEFAIGPPSTIYRRETCRPFDIYDHLRKTQARMLISHSCYHSMAKDGPMSMDSLYGYLEDHFSFLRGSTYLVPSSLRPSQELYARQIKAGTVQADELNLLWRATLTGFDADESGKVSLQEFEDIVHFVDKDRNIGMVEKLLDSTRHQLLKKKSVIQPMKSVEVLGGDDQTPASPSPEPPQPATEPPNTVPNAPGPSGWTKCPNVRNGWSAGRPEGFLYEIKKSSQMRGTFGIMRHCHGMPSTSTWFSPAMAAAFMGAHPMRAEVVCWPSCHGYLLATIFCLLSLRLLERDGGQASEDRFCCSLLRWRLWEWVLIGMALLCKAAAVTFPLVIGALQVAQKLRTKGSAYEAASAGFPVRYCPLILACVASALHASGQAPADVRSLTTVESWLLGAARSLRALLLPLAELRGALPLDHASLGGAGGAFHGGALLHGIGDIRVLGHIVVARDKCVNKQTMALRPKSVDDWCQLMPNLLEKKGWNHAKVTPGAALMHTSCPWGGQLIKFELLDILIHDAPSDPANVMVRPEVRTLHDALATSGWRTESLEVLAPGEALVEFTSPWRIVKLCRVLFGDMAGRVMKPD
eukprot:g20603.t2